MPKPIDPEYGMCEPVVDALYWDHPFSVKGRASGFSWCMKCGRTWNWEIGNFDIPIGPGRGCFPVCADCGHKMSVEELLELLGSHDKWTAQFYPMVGPKGEQLLHDPMDLEYASDALFTWQKHKKPGETPSMTAWRLRDEGNDGEGETR